MLKQYLKGPMVYLVGAGPGDPRLLTIKGRDCLGQADVIIYDRLINRRLLSYAKADAKLIFAGKSPERHVLNQSEINQVMLQEALAGNIVVRLKGGDPFVFGRGGEEAEVLAKHGIPFEVVPGITSAIGVPAYAGIPVTHRGHNSSLAIITGNEDPDKEETALAWDKISTGAGTLVFLMGMANLPGIVKNLIQHGRCPTTPVAVIRWGTRPEQRTVTGNLADIANKVKVAQIGHPAIIVVGEVVNLRESLVWYEKKPLFGKRVLVTRSREQAGDLSAIIENLGGEPWEFPVIEIAPPLDFTPLDAALGRLDKYDWIVFTSINGVRSFFDRMRQLRVDIRQLAGCRLAAIGPKTKSAIENYGLMVEHVPDEYVAEAVIEFFRQQNVQGQRFLLPRADIARKLLVTELAAMGAHVDAVDVYRTIKGSADTALLKELFQRGAIHAVTLTSSSTAKNLVEMLGKENLFSLLNGVAVACIGPITAQTARELGLPVHVVAKEYTIEGLMEALLIHFGSKDCIGYGEGVKGFGGGG